MRSRIQLAALGLALLACATGCTRQNAGSLNPSPGVLIEQSSMLGVQEKIENAATSAPPKIMRGTGLAGVLGGARVKVLKGGTHEVLLPIPQLSETQIPVAYAIATTPREAGKAYRLRQRDEANTVVTVQLNGGRDQEVQIHWSATVLLFERPGSINLSVPARFMKETACVQSGANQVRTLADKLGLAQGQSDANASKIQEFIRTIKQQKQPRSMDALGILESGGNWICTANANLAAALLRSKNIPARTIAVVPTTSQRLEMHRVVDYWDTGQWHTFDPSSLQKDIPMKPWQNIIMSRTTIGDEDLAMKPRMGSSLGCPYGQELELMDDGITLWGNDFFWTLGTPLAEFEPGDEAINVARREWIRFTETGRLSQGQIKAASAKNDADLLQSLNAR